MGHILLVGILLVEISDAVLLRAVLSSSLDQIKVVSLILGCTILASVGGWRLGKGPAHILSAVSKVARVLVELDLS